MVGLYLMVQWLVAAHACEPVTVGVALAAAAHADCGDADEPAADGDALCQAHCHPPGQASADAPAVDLSGITAGWCLVAAVSADLPGLAPRVAAVTVPRPGAPPGWPPLYLVHQVLRN